MHGVITWDAHVLVGQKSGIKTGMATNTKKLLTDAPEFSVPKAGFKIFDARHGQNKARQQQLQQRRL